MGRESPINLYPEFSGLFIPLNIFGLFRNLLQYGGPKDFPSFRPLNIAKYDAASRLQNCR